jgi:hypothetical protein
MRWSCDTGEASILGGEDLRHRVASEMATPDINECPNDVTNHLFEEP